MYFVEAVDTITHPVHVGTVFFITSAKSQKRFDIVQAKLILQYYTYVNNTYIDEERHISNVSEQELYKAHHIK